MDCLSCGETNKPGLRYCVNCGSALSAAVEPGLVASDSLVPGTVLKGTYELVRMIGEGGAGTVYEARHVDLGHPVAIKVLFTQLARIEAIRERFIAEGQIQANLRHPNVVAVSDIVDEGGVVAIVMEYVEGDTLHAYIQGRRRPISQVKAVQVVLRLLAGLGAAHASGVIHRDIKPGNVLLARTEGGFIPKLADFGIAKVASVRGRTVTGTKMGTLHYMAPEQFRDARRVTQTADIYSLGVTSYELLTGRLPFETDNDYTLMKAHLEVKAPSVRGFRPDISKGLDQVLAKALEKRPANRFQSCEAMAEALVAQPEFRTLAGYRSVPAVVDDEPHSRPRAVRQRPARSAARPPVIGVGAAASASRRARSDRTVVDGPRNTRAEPSRGRDEPPSRRRKLRRVARFPLFLAAFAVALVAVVVVWWIQQRPATSPGVGLTELESPVNAEGFASAHPRSSTDAAVGAGGDAGEGGPSDHGEGAIAFVPDGESCGELLDLCADRSGLDPERQGELLAQLEAGAESCRQVLMAGTSDSPFAAAWAEAQADLLVIAKYELRALSEPDHAAACRHVMLAERVYDRAINRLRTGVDRNELQAFERNALRELGLRMIGEQSQLHGRFTSCQNEPR